MEKKKHYKKNIAAIINGYFTVHIPLPKNVWENEITDINGNLNDFIAKMDRLLKISDTHKYFYNKLDNTNQS